MKCDIKNNKHDLVDNYLAAVLLEEGPEFEEHLQLWVLFDGGKSNGNCQFRRVARFDCPTAVHILEETAEPADY